MKGVTLVLLLSLAANLALAALVYSRRAPANATPANPASDSTPGTPTAGTGPATVESAVVAAANAPARPEDVAYLARLRASGMPAQLIRNLVYQRIYDRYRERFKALRPNFEDKYWLGYDFSGVRGTSAEDLAKRREIQRVVEAEVQALLGDGPEALGEYERILRDRMTTYLSNAKIQQVEAIRKDYDELAGSIRARARGLPLKADREALRLLEQERRADLAATLTPEELGEYDLRASYTSTNVRNRLQFFEPTEEEFRAITRIQLAIDQQFGTTDLTGDEMDRKKAAEKNFPTQVQEVLTPARFAEFKATIDGAFSETLYFTNAYNLERTVAVDLMTLKQQTWQRIDALQEAGLSAELRASSLKSLAEETERQLLARLGPEVFEKYKNTNPSWMNRLKTTPTR
jgi:hypothetical protein